MRVPPLGWTPRWNRLKSNCSVQKLNLKTKLIKYNKLSLCLLRWMYFIYSFLHFSFSSLFLFLAWGGQRLEVGSQFPDQGWNMGLCGKKRRVWTHRSLSPTPGNSLLDLSFLENQQLLPFHPIRQEEQQKWKTLLACYYMLVSLGQWP